jgi:hypothetical protein
LTKATHDPFFGHRLARWSFDYLEPTCSSDSGKIGRRRLPFIETLPLSRDRGHHDPRIHEE